MCVGVSPVGGWMFLREILRGSMVYIDVWVLVMIWCDGSFMVALSIWCGGSFSMWHVIEICFYFQFLWDNDENVEFCLTRKQFLTDIEFHLLLYCLGLTVYIRNLFVVIVFYLRSEINLGVERSGFTLVRFRKQTTSETELFVRVKCSFSSVLCC